jgi:hypothetical protein
VAKRSPILGYNHNVRYRGLIFHVQTEDSGVLSPHLFTHLFHTGVIVSTRKLVYDSGSAEDAIKSLMQAQHRAVLKDLRRGVFDDKIDVYLAGTPGLLPRDEAARSSEPEMPRPSDPVIEIVETPNVEVPHDQTQRQPVVVVEPDAPHTIPQTVPMPVLHDATLRDARPPGMVARTQTAERKSGPTQVQSSLVMAPPLAASDDGDSNPDIEIQLELDDPDELVVSAPDPVVEARRRNTRDTLLTPPPDSSDGVPSFPSTGSQSAIVPPGRVSTPPAIPPPRVPGASVGAAALPPPRPITRPPARPAITPPQVVSRPLVGQTSDVIEVYAPPPPSAEAPPGENRPATTYAQHRRAKTNVEAASLPPPSPPLPRTPPAIPAGLAKPRAAPARPPGLRDSGQSPVVRAPSQEAPSDAIPTTRTASETSASLRDRTPTPTRATGTAPAAARNPSPNSGVVMTRPAVIVGAPSKSTPSRVRKAREDEGRGFGQGLISEKSLDEVILAYLSEDADDKK